MAPFITNSAFRLHPRLSRLYLRLLNAHSKIHKLSSSMRHKLHSAVSKNLHARQLSAPISFYHSGDIGPGPGPDPASPPSNVGEGAPVRHRDRLYPTPPNHLSVWAYLALAFVILAVVTVISYMIYSCYHTAGLRARSKPEMSVGASADAGVVKGGWQTLEDPVREVGDSQPAKDRDVGEKVDDYQDQDRKVGSINPWSDGKRSGLKGLGIQLYTSSKSQHDSHPNESQASIISGSPHSTCSDRSLGSTSDHKHEQDLESSEGSDCPSMGALPLAHTTERCLQTHLPMPLPLPLPLPLPITPSPPHQVKQKRTRLRALTQILSLNLMQNQKGRETYFELQPMITPEHGVGQSKGLSETREESSPQDSPSPRSKFSPAQFAFFANYPNCNSASSNSTTSNLNTNATFSWGNNSSCSPTTFPTTPITPLTPITPMTPVTPIKPEPSTAELQFDSNDIQFVETPARNSDASSGASPPDIQGALAAVSMSPLTRAEMLWNDPKLSPVQGAFGLDGEKTIPMMEVSPAEIAIMKTTSVWRIQRTFSSIPGSPPQVQVPPPVLATPDQVHRGYVNSRLGYLRRGVSPSSPPSPSPSSSNSASSSPSIATARFILDREGLKRDNLRNRDGLDREKGREKENMKLLSPIPRPVFLPHPKPSRFQDEQSF